MGLGGLVSRRTAISLFGGGVLAAAIVGKADAAPDSHTLWMLDPDWGSSLTTDSGSDTKLRCRSRACHLAAPHRFFLSRSDAISGRLHPCCLAQPVAVKVCIDLNLLLPYYTARLGGVDTRCAQLPAPLRSALTDRSACEVPVPDSAPTTTTAPDEAAVLPPAATLPPASTVPSTGTGALPATGASPATDTRALASSLPSTGTSAATLALGAVAAVAAGAALLAATDHSDTI